MDIFRALLFVLPLALVTGAAAWSGLVLRDTPGFLLLLLIVASISAVLFVFSFYNRFLGLIPYWVDIWQDRRREEIARKSNSFEAIFGGGATQEKVDEVLAGLAEQYDKACTTQSLQQRYHRPPLSSELWENLKGLVDQEVETTKQTFWHAHKLAKDAKFAVGRQHTDHIPQSVLTT
ncbi:hypothetical protein IH982_00975 [Patescibacteria group bacterium]|nr:hypothetical protein [Patescibacteria group bacterium]